MRVATVVAVSDHYRPQSDAYDFDRHALSIARNGTYPPALPQFGGGPSAFRPPAYPMLLAGTDLATGIPGDRSRWRVGLLVGALLGTVSIWLMGVAGRRLFGGAVALVAAGLAAVWPPFVLITTSLLSENLFVAVMLGAIAALLRWRAAGGARWLVLAGVLVGLAALTRSNGIVLALPLGLAVWTGRPRLRWNSLRPVVVVVGVALVVVAPWSIRSSLALDSPVLVSTQAGYAVSGIYDDTARREARWPWNWLPPERDPALSRAVFLAPGADEASIDRRLRTQTREYVLDDPSVVPRAAFWNGLRLLNLQGPEIERVTARYLGLNTRLAALAVFAFWLALPFAIAGAFTRRARAAPWWAWLIPVLFAASAVFTAGGLTRYRIPEDPFVLWLVACAVVAGAEWRRRGRAPARFTFSRRENG